MGMLGASAAQSLAGMNQASRVELREKERQQRPSPGEAPARRKDEDSIVVVQVEPAEQSRTLKGNEQEEAHEDRIEHATYSRRGSSHGDAPRLDVKG